ncbi:MAG TPA: PAS domain-containing sensor histidine kinase [Gemmatimonadaceae bacterium]
MSQLEPSDHLYRLLVESVADYAIFVLDTTGHIRSWNPGAQRLKGYSAEEIIGKHFSTFYPGADVVAQKPAKLLEIASHVGRVEDEGWRVRKDGTQFWANVVITALHDEDGALIGFAKITRDLTERRNAEEQARSLAAERAARQESEAHSQRLLQLTDELQQQAVELEAQTEEAQSLSEELEQANEELQQQAVEAEAARAEADAANRAKTEFLAVMSHELRTPLNAIAGYADLLRMGIRGPVTPQQLDDLERIARSERTLLALVNDVLNYARMEAGQVHYADERVVVASLLADIEALVLPQLEAKNLQFTLGECDADLAVRADPDKVQQILVNLMSNAVKFTPPGGSVDVTCGGDASVVRIRARDTGIGIPPDKLQLIFEPFVQLDRSLTSTKEGSGLGLAISRDLARAMGGDLGVESTVGRGSTFVLTLRRDRASAS